MSVSRKRFAAALSLGVAVTGLSFSAAPAANASPDGSGIVIREVYGAGGNSGATYDADFVELYNPSGGDLPLTGMSVQYRSSGGTTGTPTALSGTLAAGDNYLIQMSGTGANGVALPTPDLVASPAISMSGSNGQVLLLPSSTPFAGTGDVAGNAAIVDMVGYGNSSVATYEGASTGTSLTSTTSAQRSNDGVDTDNNANDFSEIPPTPGADFVQPGADCPEAPQTIAEIQGEDTDTSPCSTVSVTTQGVVTASYPEGGLNGFYLQTGGTGGDTDATPDASDGVFVYAGFGIDAADYPAVGDSVEVTGDVTEYFGLTEIALDDESDVTAVTPALDPVTPQSVVPGTDCALPGDQCLTGAELDAAREAHESELFQPDGDYTVTDAYDGSPAPSTSSSFFGEIGLAAESDIPLTQPTEVIDAQDSAAIAARTAYNDAHRVILDDGSSTNYTTTTDQPFPWLTKTHYVRDGAAVDFPKPLVLTYGNGSFKLEPQGQVVGDSTGTVDFAQDRPGSPDKVGGDIRLATFNVLNYFPTTGEEFAAIDGNSCTYYTDRLNNPITDNNCTPDGPRGAANAVNLKRQQDKIVTAINKLRAGVVSLEEIENSVKFGKNRDFAVKTLVNALNADAGRQVWDYVPSPGPAELPTVGEQDVIRNAFIYKPNQVKLVGDSKVLVGSEAFSNAREPLAQAFKAKGGKHDDAFSVIVNHFKSKGSGTPDPDGQGNANADRVAQAQALRTFADDFSSDLDASGAVFLTGDFNAYTEEDPAQVLTSGGYTELTSTKDPDEESYNFAGLNGSLDHVFANDAALALVNGVDVWNINADESVYYEYSRFNYNVTDLYTANQFRASDHNPEVVGLNLPDVQSPEVTLNLLNINDFHGRIDKDITTRWATTIEQLREEGGEGNTLLLSAGDNIGASLFNSASDDDNPTIDVLNALDLDSSAVGNHEFDKGFADLTGRVQDRATWTYLGANVYEKGTTTPALPEYDTFEVDGITVGVIGAVTQDVPSLVSPAGITDLDFGDPVEAVNRVADQLTDGDQNNGEADVIVAEYHEGAPNGDVEGATLASNLADSPTFAEIANDTSPKVDAIFTGHTHKKYAYSAPVTGGDTATRPIIQSGNYGDFVGHVTLTVDSSTGKVTSHSQENVAKATSEDLSYPRVQQVKQITDAAIAAAAVIGNVPVSAVTADITTAYGGGSFVGGKYVGGTRDNRSAESSLGDLVAQAYVDGLPEDLGSPDLGIVNPGGLRAELFYAGDTSNNPANTDGVVTNAEANGVLPFANNMSLVQLTGAQLKMVLEQQWQTDANGDVVSSRPYQQLGLSENVAVTADASKPMGSRITSVRIDGEPLDPARTYTISTVSFLATGGDNFRAFLDGTSTDTGLLDRDLWLGYLADAAPITPDFARQQVFETGKPDSVASGDHVEFTLGTDLVAPDVPNTGETLNLNSLGSPENTTLDIAAVSGGTSTDITSVDVTDGVANVAFDAPAGLVEGDTIILTAQPSGTTVTIPVAGAGTPDKVGSTVSGTIKPKKVKVDKTKPKLFIEVEGAGGVEATGEVKVRIPHQKNTTVTLKNGKAKLKLGKFGKKGKTTIRLHYLGSDLLNGDKSSVTFKVVKK